MSYARLLYRLFSHCLTEDGLVASASCLRIRVGAQIRRLADAFAKRDPFYRRCRLGRVALLFGMLTIDLAMYSRLELRNLSAAIPSGVALGKKKNDCM